jgi:hypothetical protein
MAGLSGQRGLSPRGMIDPMTEQELIAAIARDAIADLSPSELPLFPAVQRAYFQRGGTAGAVSNEGEAYLGFGLGAEVVALAPAALAVATSVFSFAATQIGEAAKKERTAVISEQMRSLFKRFHTGKADAGARFSAAQFAQVRAIAHEKARALKVPEEKATLLADAIVGRLAATPTAAE